MKNKILIVAFLLSAFLLLSGFTFSVGDGIDRSEKMMFPEIPLGVEKVYVNIKFGNVYHRSKHCDVEEVLLGLSTKDNTLMTAYEAVLRGFVACPDCHSTVSDIYYDIDDILNTVESIYDILDQ